MRRGAPRPSKEAAGSRGAAKENLQPDHHLPRLLGFEDLEQFVCQPLAGTARRFIANGFDLLWLNLRRVVAPFAANVRQHVRDLPICQSVSPRNHPVGIELLPRNRERPLKSIEDDSYNSPGLLG